MIFSPLIMKITSKSDKSYVKKKFEEMKKFAKIKRISRLKGKYQVSLERRGEHLKGKKEKLFHTSLSLRGKILFFIYFFSHNSNEKS